MKLSLALFDLDGTLTDSKLGIINSVIYSLNKLGYYDINPSNLYFFLGPPLKDSFQQLLNCSDTIAEIAVNYYRENFTEKGIYENNLFPDIDKMLNILSQKNITLVLSTSKPLVYAKIVLNHFGIEKYFDGVYGSELNGNFTDKTEIIAHILKQYPKVDKENIIMIGDRKFDIIGAKSNNIKSIAVTYGYGNMEELSLVNPDYYAKDAREIQLIIESLQN